jgi:ABC-type dipeptide/oligopeptide/nickel transport system ATPase component
MRHGRVVERGATAQILDDPQDAYTRLLVQSVPRPGWTPSRTRAAEPATAVTDA